MGNQYDRVQEIHNFDEANQFWRTNRPYAFQFYFNISSIAPVGALGNMPLPQHVSAFVDRWTQKRERYGTERLDDCFDRFFTSFVIYNFLYGWITQSEGYSLSGDREMATKVPKKYLSAGVLHGNDALREATTIIAEQLRSGYFTLKNPDEDQKILQKLSSTDPAQWSIGMMQAIYQVRCNTFHGEKGFESHQRAILRPSTSIIEIVSALILEKSEG
jgi:hypothetical protein